MTFSRFKPWLFSLIGGSALLLFWTYMIRSGQEASAVQPTPSVGSAAGGSGESVLHATSDAPWGAMSIDVTVQNGRWTDIQAVRIPDSPPSYRAVPQLIRQALAAQSDAIDGVSGATYTSDAFRDDLTQILSQSKK